MRIWKHMHSKEAKLILFSYGNISDYYMPICATN